MNYMEGKFTFSQVYFHVFHVPPVKIPLCNSVYSVIPSNFSLGELL